MFKPKTKQELQDYVNDLSNSLENVDTSLITDMSELFYSTQREDFSGIENWNVSNVEDLTYMFDGAIYFNQDIGDWDVSNVEDMSYMFYDATSFNQNIDSWDISSVKNMYNMFKGAKSLKIMPERYK